MFSRFDALLLVLQLRGPVIPGVGGSVGFIDIDARSTALGGGGGGGQGVGFSTISTISPAGATTARSGNRSFHQASKTKLVSLCESSTQALAWHLRGLRAEINQNRLLSSSALRASPKVSIPKQ